MNKLMSIPLFFMFILCIISVAYGIVPDESSTLEIDTNENPPARHIWNLWGLIDTSAESDESRFQFSLWIGAGAIGILVAAIAIASASGITVLGSGLTEYSQRSLFNGIVYLGLWGVLSLASFTMIVFDESGIGWIIWTVLTLMYLLGYVQEQNYGAV